MWRRQQHVVVGDRWPRKERLGIAVFSECYIELLTENWGYLCGYQSNKVRCGDCCQSIVIPSTIFPCRSWKKIKCIYITLGGIEKQIKNGWVHETQYWIYRVASVEPKPVQTSLGGITDRKAGWQQRLRAQRVVLVHLRSDIILYFKKWTPDKYFGASFKLNPFGYQSFSRKDFFLEIFWFVV